MVRRGDDNQRIVGKGLGHQFGLHGRPPHYRQLLLVVGELAQQRLAVGDVQAEAHTRVALIEHSQQPTCEVIGGTGDGDLQPAALHALELFEYLGRLFQLQGNSPAVVEHFLARLGEVHLLAQMIEQRQTHLVL